MTWTRRDVLKTLTAGAGTLAMMRNCMFGSAGSAKHGQG